MNNLSIVVFDKNDKDVTNERDWFVDVKGDLYYVEKESLDNSQSMDIDMEGNIVFRKNEKQISSIKGTLVLANTNEYTYQMEIRTNFKL